MGILEKGKLLIVIQTSQNALDTAGDFF